MARQTNTGEQNITKKSPGRYLVRFKYQDPLTGDQEVYHKTIQGSLRDAIAHRDEAKASCRRRGKHRSATVRVEDCEASFLSERATRSRGRASKPLRAATLERDAIALDEHILPALGRWRIESIEYADLERVVDGWLHKRRAPTKAEVARAAKEKREPVGELYSIASVNVWIKVTRLLLRHAYKRAGLGRSPAEDLKALPDDRGRRGRALGTEEVTALLDELKQHHGHYWLVALLQLVTSARFGTISALHIEDLDYDEDILDLSHSVNEGRRYATSKTGKRLLFPFLPILKDAVAWHRQHLLATKHPGLGSGILCPARVSDPDQAAYRGYLSRTGYRKALATACESIGIERATSHDFRRTLNTWLMQGGVSTEMIQSITGHSTSHMTVHYAHISPQAKAVALAPVVLALANAGG